MQTASHTSSFYLLGLALANLQVQLTRDSILWVSSDCNAQKCDNIVKSWTRLLSLFAYSIDLLTEGHNICAADSVFRRCFHTDHLIVRRMIKEDAELIALRRWCLDTDHDW